MTKKGYNKSLDEINVALLKLLRENPAMKYTDMQDRVHMSVTSVSARVRKLVSDRVIIGLDVDEKKLGCNFDTYMLFVELNHKYELDELDMFAASCNNVMDMYNQPEKGGCAMIVQVDSTDTLYSLIHRISGLRCVQKVESCALSNRRHYHDTVDLLPAV